MHLTYALAAGCRGAKLWLSRGVYGEIDSGIQYRNMLCTNRKRMLLEIFQRFCGLDYFELGEDEIMLRTGTAMDGSGIVMMMDLSLDECDYITLGGNAVPKVRSVWELMPDSYWQTLPSQSMPMELSPFIDNSNH